MLECAPAPQVLFDLCDAGHVAMSTVKQQTPYLQKAPFKRKIVSRGAHSLPSVNLWWESGEVSLGGWLRENELGFNMVLLLTYCVTSDKLLNLSELQVLPL